MSIDLVLAESVPAVHLFFILWVMAEALMARDSHRNFFGASLAW